MSTIVKTLYSTYEVEFNDDRRSRIRRLGGDSEPTALQGDDLLWVEADKISRVNGCLWILWDAPSGRGTLSSEIVSEIPSPEVLEDDVQRPKWRKK